MERARSLLWQHRYYRFNVQQGLQDIKLEEKEKQSLVEAAAEYHYNHQEQKNKARDCARMLSGLKVSSNATLNLG